MSQWVGKNDEEAVAIKAAMLTARKDRVLHIAVRPSRALPVSVRSDTTFRIGPLPRTSMMPRAASSKRPASSSRVAGATWIFPASPVDSMRDAVFTASPHTS